MKKQKRVPSERSILRLRWYRRVLQKALDQRSDHIFSHQIAEDSGTTPEMVRRDFMEIGCPGSSRYGYTTQTLLDALDHFFGFPEKIPVIVVGLGRVGTSIARYFSSNQTAFHVVAGFDSNLSCLTRSDLPFSTYSIDQFEYVVSNQKVDVGVIAVPQEAAQKICNLMVEKNVRVIINFAPLHLMVPDNVYIENVDITTLLEKAYFLGMNEKQKGATHVFLPK